MPPAEKSNDQISLELQKARTENAMLQERLDRIAEISAAIIYILDIDGHFTFINRAVDDILHYAPDELIGKHFSTIMPQEEYERVSRMLVLPKFRGKTVGLEQSPKLFDERRTGERRTRNLEVQLLTKEHDGVRILVGDVTGIVAVEGAYDSRKIDGHSNMLNGFLGSQGVIFDITKYKKVQKERMEFQRRLFETQKLDAVGRLAGKVAHDMNNKLGSIIGSAEMIQQDFSGGNADLAMYADTILSASKHAAELSSRLLEFSRRDDHVVADVNLHELIDRIVELIRNTEVPAIRATKHYHVEAAMVRGNQVGLQNAIMNIATNACDAMEALGGELRFETRMVDVDKQFLEAHSFARDQKALVLLSITDTGPGMDKIVMNRVFEPFFTTKAVDGGLGLGLASVRDCLKTHGGCVEVASEPGKGSRFDLYFPAIASQQQNTP
jgi:two-component system, cell cycle sensor histidine kinase and response regulator CckA